MLLTGRNLGKSFGPRQLFSGITIGLSEGERIGLIGANGSGKSTLLRIFAGVEHADEGELIARRQLRVGYVPQEDTFDMEQSCLDCVVDVMDDHIDLHDREVAAAIALSRAGFPDEHAVIKTLSGGWKKRLAIVRQLCRDPDLLLMDEPTNHLDLEGIYWLEELIEQAQFATLIVSHDRRFLNSIANRVVELGKMYPDGYFSHNGTYTEFLEKRESFLESQRGLQQALASGVRREIEWLKRGAKARTTKAKGRIDRAHEMMGELAALKDRNAQQGSAQIDFNSSDRKTRKLIHLENVSKSLGDRKLFENVTLTLSPGTKLGLLGPNGSGKSTLIKLLTGKLPTDSGSVVQADQLKVVVFDQHREQLEQSQILRRALSPMGDQLSFNGQSMHITGWAKRFLFRPDQLDLPVSDLSGGEQARVLIARLMLREADVLILDEPTNDLDIPTLDVLEESLEQFPGAIVLVTHDRYLLDRVSTEILALDGKGKARIYADLDQWEQSQKHEPMQRVETKKAQPKPEAVKPVAPAKKKLSWAEQKELEKMEQTIHAAEEKVAQLQVKVNDPGVLSDHIKSHAAFSELGAAQAEVDRLYARWTELEEKK